MSGVRLFLLRIGLTLVAAGAASASVPAWSKTSPERKEESGRYFRLAQVQLEQDKTMQAIDSVNKAIELDPDNAEAHYFLGYIHYQQSEYKPAERELKKAIKINPYYTDAHNHLGLVYRETKDYDKAMAEFEAALKDKAYRNPERIHLNMGFLYLDRGMVPEAVAQFQKSVAINPSYARGHLGLGKAYTKAGQSRQADEELRKVVALGPDSPEAEEARQLLGHAVKPAGS